MTINGISVICHALEEEEQEQEQENVLFNDNVEEVGEEELHLKFRYKVFFLLCLSGFEKSYVEGVALIIQQCVKQKARSRSRQHSKEVSESLKQ